MVKIRSMEKFNQKEPREYQESLNQNTGQSTIQLPQDTCPIQQLQQTYGATIATRGYVANDEQHADQLKGDMWAG